MENTKIVRRLASLHEKKGDACLATIVQTEGSTPRKVGAKMLIFVDGSTFGSVGGGCGENQVKSAAYRCLVTHGGAEMIEVDLTNDLGTRGSDVCGGRMKIFIEPI
jgi:xanthine/CO dehydrogenase XdhC/CoxF family maturation factor